MRKLIAVGSLLASTVGMAQTPRATEPAKGLQDAVHQSQALPHEQRGEFGVLDRTLDTILNESWPAMRKLTPSEGLPEPAVRMIQLQAFLALNELERAMCVQASLAPADLEEWLRWAKDFQTLFPDAPVAGLFLGDAYARLGQWTRAMHVFRHGLTRRADHALLRNALAVVLAAQGSQYEAADSLAQADSSLAVTQLNLCAFFLYISAGARAAETACDQALNLDPNSSLAWSGRLSARLMLPGGEEASPTIPDHIAGSCGASIVPTNLARVRSSLDRDQAAESDLPPGTQLDRMAARVERGDMKAVKQMVATVSRFPEQMPYAIDKLSAIAAKDPILRGKIGQEFLSNDKRILGLDTFYSFAQGISMRLERFAERSAGIGFRGLELGTDTGSRLNFGWDFSPGIDNQRQKNSRAFSTNDSMMRKYSAQTRYDPVRGVIASPVGAVVDEGNWPVVPHFAFGYPVPSSATSLRKEVQ